MSKKEKDQIAYLYEKSGFTPMQAIDRLLSPALHDDAERLADNAAEQFAVTLGGVFQSPAMAEFSKLAIQVGAPSAYWTEHSKHLRSELLKLVRDGCIWIAGYQAPRHLSDRPQLVPLDIVLRGKIDWSKETISGEGVTIVAFRIIPNAQYEAKHLATTQIGSMPPSGRPGIGDKIRDALSKLIAAGKIDFDEPMTAAHRQIVNEVARSNPGTKVPARTTLQKFANPILKSELERRSGSSTTP